MDDSVMTVGERVHSLWHRWNDDYRLPQQSVPVPAPGLVVRCRYVLIALVFVAAFVPGKSRADQPKFCDEIVDIQRNHIIKLTEENKSLRDENLLLRTGSTPPLTVKWVSFLPATVIRCDLKSETDMDGGMVYNSAPCNPQLPDSEYKVYEFGLRSDGNMIWREGPL